MSQLKHFCKISKSARESMMEHNPQMNRGEQYPLLKVENVDGSGDTARGQPPPTVVRTGWNVTCNPKQSWFQRWPEIMSACWMTFILFAISFLVFYALGMNAYRRQPVVVYKCNNSKPASDVYFHCIVPRSQKTLPRYSEFLASMATQYPFLRFNVHFLVEDSQTYLQNINQSRFMKQLIPTFPRTISAIIEQSNKRDILDFQRRYQNMNITLVSLSKYMSKTPLRYIWRTLPLTYLPFYARVLSVWETGGIGFDLATFNHIYHNHQDVSNKIKAILKQHNDGIETEKYVSILNSMDAEDDSKMFASIINMINVVLNQTGLLFNTDMTSEVKFVENTPLIRTHRTKRDVEFGKNNKNISNNKLDMNNTSEDIIVVKSIKINNNLNSTNMTAVNENDIAKTINATKSIASNNTKVLKKTASNPEPVIAKKAEVSSDYPEMSIFYYFSLFDDIGPFYSLPIIPLKTEASREGPPMKITEFKRLAKQDKQLGNHLSISSDGVFVAAPLRYHPFLAQLLSTGCKRVNPKIAIEDTFMNQCSVFVRDDVYCDNIHIIDSVY